MALEKRRGILSEVTKTIDDVSDCLEQGGKLIVAVEEFRTLAITAAEKALQVHREIQNEEIKRIYQVGKALRDLDMVAQKAFIFLDKVDDVVSYCGGDSMKTAREQLRFSVDLHQREGFWGAIWRGYHSFLDMLTHTPDLSLLRDLFEKLKHSLAEAERSYLDFIDACDTASQNCSEAAEICARHARMARERYDTTCIVGSTTSGLAIGAGLLALVTGGVGLAVVGAAVGAAAGVMTLHIAQEYARSEASFRSIKGEFDFSVKLAFDLRQEVSRVHVNLENISTQVDDIAYCMKNGSSMILVQDALKRLHQVCQHSRGTTSRCRERVSGRLKELTSPSVYYVSRK